MVRGKTQMKRIENASSRQVTFSKRRNGLLKKAYELSVLCDAEVGLVIFSAKGRLSEFASPSMQKMLEKYQKYSQESGTRNTTNQQDTQYMKQEIANMEERIRILESSQRNMVGDGLESCSMKELTKLESQVEKGLSHIRASKTKILVDQIELLERKGVTIFVSDTSIFVSSMSLVLVSGDFVYATKRELIMSSNVLKTGTGNQTGQGSTRTGTGTGNEPERFDFNEPDY